MMIYDEDYKEQLLFIYGLFFNILNENFILKNY